MHAEHTRSSSASRKWMRLAATKRHPQSTWEQPGIRGVIAGILHSPYLTGLKHGDKNVLNTHVQIYVYMLEVELKVSQHRLETLLCRLLRPQVCLFFNFSTLYWYFWFPKWEEEGEEFVVRSGNNVWKVFCYTGDKTPHMPTMVGTQVVIIKEDGDLRFKKQKEKKSPK